MSLTTTECLLLLAISSITSGLAGGMRRVTAKHVGAMAFSSIYACTQFLFSLILWASLSFPTEDVEPIKVFYICLSGFGTLIAMYLIFAANLYLKTSTAMSCSSIQYIVGLTLDYVVDDADIILKYFIIASGVAFVALFTLVFAENTLEVAADIQKTKLEAPRVEEEESQCLLSHSCDILDSGVVNIAPAVKSDNFWFWVGIAVIGGLLLAAQFILPTIAFSGDGAVSNPCIMLVSFLAGEVIAIPFAVCLFGYLDILGISDGTNEISCEALQTWWRITPTDELWWTFAIGLFVGLGNACYFYGSYSGSVPVAVACAITMSKVLVAVFASVFLFQDFAGTHLTSWVYILLLLGSLLFGGAIFVYCEYSIA